MNMNEDPLVKLKRIQKKLNEPFVIPFISPNGRMGYKCFSQTMGHFEIHICETREDVIANEEGRW